jgi:glycogen operon protein
VFVRPGEAGLATDETGRQPVEDGSGRVEQAATVRTPVPSGAPPLADIHWHGVEPFKPDFRPRARYLAFTLDGRFTGRDGDPDYKPDRDVYVAMNVTPAPLSFTVPASPTGRRWHVVIDTTAPSPKDIVAEDEGAAVAPREVLTVPPFGMVVLMSEE